LTDITVFLPMRLGSQRVENKNTKLFAGIEGGLSYIKISQLLKVDRITEIIVSTDDEKVKNIARSFKSKKVIVDDRPKCLASSEASTDDLIKYGGSLIDEGVILTTYVTSPFVNESIYNQAIELYLENLPVYDSLMSVTKIQKFIWNKEQPINYDPSNEKWPRTQTIEPLYEINSGIFLVNADIYKKENDRIGRKPFFFEISGETVFDIDWKDDFDMAEVLWSKYGKI